MTIYLVTQGCYSDYGVEAAFSTKEKAEEYIATQYPPGAETHIEEYALDAPFTPKVFKSRYHVILNLETGALEDRRGRNPWEEKDVEWDGKTRGFWCVSPPRPSYSYAQGVSFISAEHAMKLAVEGRQAWLREKFTDYRQFEEQL